MSSSCVFDFLKNSVLKLLDLRVYVTWQYASVLLKVLRQALYTVYRKITTPNTINIHNSTLQYFTCYKGRYNYQDGMSQLHKTFYCSCFRCDPRNNKCSVSHLKCEIQQNYVSNAFTSSQKTLGCYGSKDLSSKG